MRHAEGIERIVLEDGAVLKIDNTMHVLNETALLIFDLFDGARNMREIMKEMESICPEERIEDIVESFIAQLREANLVHE